MARTHAGAQTIDSQPTYPALSPTENTGLTWPIRLAVYLGLVVLATAIDISGDGNMSSKLNLLLSLGVDPETREIWTMREIAPFAYRRAFQGLVMGVFRFLPQDAGSFYWCFVICSAACMYLAAVCYDWFLRVLGLRTHVVFLGGCLFLLQFPIVFGHNIPVQVREDFLGYAAIAVIAICVLRDNWLLVALSAAAGVWVRETCLVGMVAYLFVSARPIWQRLAAYAIPGAMLIAIRVIYAAPERADGTMDYWYYLKMGLQENYLRPLEMLTYLFATFGVLWLAALWQLKRRDVPLPKLLGPIGLFVAWAATAATGWTIGIIRENRITFILFPWIITLGVIFLTGPRFARIRRSRAAWIAAAAVLLLGLGFLGWIQQDYQRLVPVRRYLNHSFHLGPAPTYTYPAVDGQALTIDLSVPLPDPNSRAGLRRLYASPLNGIHVLLNLAAVAFLIAGGIATRAAPSQEPAARPDASAAPDPAPAPATE